MRLRQGMLALYALTMLALPAAIAWSSWHDYQRTLHDLEHETLSIARLLQEHALRSISSAELAMQNLTEDIQRAGGVPWINEYQEHQRFQQKIQLTPHIRAIIATDAQGLLRVHGLEYPTRQISLSDREYFAFHRDSPDKRGRIGAPIISRTDAQWLIPVTMRVNSADDSFGGLLLAGVEPNYYLQFYASLKLIAGTQIHLLRNDGTILLTYPLQTGELGKNLRDIDPDTSQHLGQSGPIFYSQRDQQGRQLHIAQLKSPSDHPLAIRISVEHEHAFAQFRQDTRDKVGMGLLLLLVLSFLTWLLLRQIKRVEVSDSQLYFTQFSVDESPDMIMWCDHGGRIRYANRCLAENSQYQARELLQLKFSDLMADSRELWESLQVQMLMLKRQPTNQTLRTELQAQRRQILQSHLRRQDGRSIPVEITLSLIEYCGEVYLCISARDITERKQAEYELRQHRDHLQDLVDERTAEIRTVLDASPLAIALSVQDHIRLVNPAFMALFGHETAPLGVATSALCGSETRYQQLRQLITQQLALGNTYRGELQLQRSDGSDFWALLFARAIGPSHPERGTILVIEDITAQRLAAQAIRQSERLKRTIIDTTADGFALIDADRTLIEINPALCAQLGQLRQTLLGRNVDTLWGALAQQLFPPPHDPDHNQHFQEILLLRPDGETHPYLANSGMIRDENGLIEHTFVFLTDISRQKEIEYTLLEAKEAAEGISQAKTTFLANMSHELRTPMHAILSFSEMGMQKAGQVEPEQTMRYFERIQASGKRLLGLLNDLLDMSRLEANKMVYDKTIHVLQVTVNAALSEMSSLLAAKQLKVRLDSRTAPLPACYDKARLTQVLVNLLSNAIKFSPEQGEIHIHFLGDARFADGKPAVGLVVRDCGPGIPQSDLDHIFETFTQSSKNQRQGGTGLGLAISRQIIRDHHGKIQASNHPDGGAMLTVLLPVPDTAQIMQASKT